MVVDVTSALLKFTGSGFDHAWCTSLSITLQRPWCTSLMHGACHLTRAGCGILCAGMGVICHRSCTCGTSSVVRSCSQNRASVCHTLPGRVYHETTIQACCWTCLSYNFNSQADLFRSSLLPNSFEPNAEELPSCSQCNACNDYRVCRSVVISEIFHCFDRPSTLDPSYLRSWERCAHALSHAWPC